MQFSYGATKIYDLLPNALKHTFFLSLYFFFIFSFVFFYCFWVFVFVMFAVVVVAQAPKWSKSWWKLNGKIRMRNAIYRWFDVLLCFCFTFYFLFFCLATYAAVTWQPWFKNTPQSLKIDLKETKKKFRKTMR